MSTDKSTNPPYYTEPTELPKELSFGEKLVGLEFNPSGNEKVLLAKKLCASLANLVQDNQSEEYPSYLYNLIKGSALREILNAQMNIVKLLTFKH